jgi:hypothetical protein
MNHSSFPEPLAKVLRDLPEVTKALGELRCRLRGLLDERLVGLYVNGSLTLGDFDPEQSDLDLLAALSSEVGEHELQALGQLHAQFIRKHPTWDDRVEIAYVSTEGLRTFKSRPSCVANISPGEPLNRRLVGREWIVGYYLVREHGIALLGPPPETLIDEISRDEFVGAVREYFARWRDLSPPPATRGPQRYAVLTMCRGLYALRHGGVISKKQAALWAQREFPTWAAVIEQAITAANNDPASETDSRDTARFVEFAVATAADRPQAARRFSASR